MASRPTSKQNGEGAYLTKEVLNRAVRKGVKEAANTAMKTAGSVVSTEGQWVVRNHQDGHVEKLRKLDRTSTRDIERKLNKLVDK